MVVCLRCDYFGIIFAYWYDNLLSKKPLYSYANFWFTLYLVLWVFGH